jgi:hypothetical protein
MQRKKTSLGRPLMRLHGLTWQLHDADYGDYLKGISFKTAITTSSFKFHLINNTANIISNIEKVSLN